MTRSVLLTVALCAVGVGVAFTTSPGAQTAAQSAAPVARSIQRSWNEAKRNVAESAEFMPEANYGYKPVDTVRSFGQILAHLAGANYVFCAAARGEKTPHAEDEYEKSATTRIAINKALTDSLTYCDAAFTAMTDAKLAETVTAPFGGSQESRAQVLLSQIGHVNEHYGNLVTYFRMKGLVPPSSRPR
ncbi:MAG TPA: DinB family protein [Vicinamibacterales bacterium]|nr:DinB family protein [Vicinamibacterales bacterium]